MMMKKITVIKTCMISLAVKYFLYNAFCNGGILLGFMNHDAKEK